MDRLSSWLAARGAQTDVVVWAEAYGDDWASAWSACPRGDWLLALAARAGLNSAKVGRAALAVARFGVEDLSVEALPVPRGRKGSLQHGGERFLDRRRGRDLVDP